MACRSGNPLTAMRTPFGIRASSARSWRRYYSSISCVSDRGLVRERKLIADGHHADSVPTAIPCAPLQLGIVRRARQRRRETLRRQWTRGLAHRCYVDNRPVDSDATPEGRARNRRVILFLLADIEALPRLSLAEQVLGRKELLRADSTIWRSWRELAVAVCKHKN